MSLPWNLLRNAANLMQADRHRCWPTLVEPDEAATFDDIAKAAGIEPLEKRWHEVVREAAESFHAESLHRSLAYRVELMPQETAPLLVSQGRDVDQAAICHRCDVLRRVDSGAAGRRVACGA